MASFQFHHVSLQPSEQIGLHSHAVRELSLVIAGEGMRTTGTQTAPFAAGDLVFLSPHTPHHWNFSEHSTKADGNIENISIQLPEALLSAIAASFAEMTAVVATVRAISGGVTFDDATRRAIADIMLRMTGESEAERLPSLLQIMVLMARGATVMRCLGHALRERNKQLMEQMEVWVACNFMRRITIDQAAKHAGMNRSAFCRFFKKQAGVTFVTYLNQCRLKNACQLLSQNGTTVAEAAWRSGFNDLPYFTRIFSRRMGLTPTAYKRAHGAP